MHQQDEEYWIWRTIKFIGQQKDTKFVIRTDLRKKNTNNRHTRQI